MFVSGGKVLYGHEEIRNQGLARGTCMEAWGAGMWVAWYQIAALGLMTLWGGVPFLEIYPSKPLTPSIMELYGHQVPSDLFCAISTRETTKSGPFSSKGCIFYFVHTKV